MRLSEKSTVAPVYGNEFNGSSFKRVDSGSTAHRLNQEIVISDPALWEKCSSSEWHLIGRIIRDMKNYNALWYCDPAIKKSSATRSALKRLADKKILVKTETLHIYFVNPVYIRKGEAFTVLATTANKLKNASRVTTDHIVNCKPVRNIDFGADRFLLLSQPQPDQN